MLEPAALTVIGSLAAHLELEELVAEVAVDDIVKCEALLRVVLLDEVLVDGSRLPKGETGVRVFDGRDAAVGVDVYERRFLHVIEAERFELVVKGEFLKEENGFPAIGARWGEPYTDGFRRVESSCHLVR